MQFQRNCLPRTQRCSLYRPLSTLMHFAGRGLLVIFLLLPALALADDHRFQLLLDTDNNAATGCTVATVGGNVNGIEQVLTTTVTTSVPSAAISLVERQVCANGSLGAPVVVSAGGWSAGGLGAIETYVPLSLLPPGGTMKVTAASTNATNGQDVTASFPVSLSAIAVPLSPAMFALLALLLFGASLWWLRRHTALLVVLLVTFGLSGLVWAATVVLDGSIGDWAGISPSVTDAQADAPVNADILAVYYQRDSQNLYFRIDANLQLMAPGPALGFNSCVNLFNGGDMPGAKKVCGMAADSFANTDSNDADTARFFAGVSGLSTVWNNPGGQPNTSLRTFEDVLQGFGLNSWDPRHPQKLIFPGPVSAGAPTGGEMQTFFSRTFQPELRDANGYFARISGNMNLAWTEPFGKTQVQSDYGDVLAMRAAVRYMLGSIMIGNIYDLNADFITQINAGQSPLTFLNANPHFLDLRNAAGLAEAQALLQNASNDALAGIDWMQGVNTSNHFISIQGMPQAALNGQISRINAFKSSFSGAGNFYDSQGSRIVTLNMAKFFSNPIDGSLLPGSPGSIADPTFGGIWTNFTPGGKYDPNHEYY